MKSTYKRLLVYSVVLFIAITSLYAQNGLDSIIVEKYYISNADDSIGSIGNGNLPVGSVTYRVFVSMKKHYKFQMAYGDPNHPLSIKTSSAFFNNEDRGNTNPTFTKAQAANNTVMLDSWLSAGAGCVGNFGILKSEDNSISNVVNADGILQNADTNAGIPLTVQDGFITGTPGSFGTIGIDTEIEVFNATSQAGNSFETTNGAWFCLSGATGPDTNNNKVLIGQFTTKGKFTFKLNIQIGTPSGGVEKYVAINPTGTEIQKDFLIFNSDSMTFIDTTGIEAAKKDFSFNIYPNPSNGVFNLIISADNQKSKNYYTIYDILGNIVFRKKLIPELGDNFNEKIDLTYLGTGLYFIELSINGVRTTKKLVKN